MPKIYPIGGVKGGVGKSFITASLGTLFANRGKKVVLIDLDLGASNLHTLLGIKNPQNGLDSFLDKTVQQLESSFRALESDMTDEILNELNDIWPGLGGEAPEAYSW